MRLPSDDLTNDEWNALLRFFTQRQPPPGLRTKGMTKSRAQQYLAGLVRLCNDAQKEHAMTEESYPMGTTPPPEDGETYRIELTKTPPDPPEDFLGEVLDEANNAAPAGERLNDLAGAIVTGAAVRGYKKGWRHAIDHAAESIAPASMIMLKKFRADLAKHMRQLATRQTDATQTAITNACADAVETYPLPGEVS